MRRVSDQPQEPIVEGRNVLWRKEWFSPEELEALLPDGTRVKATGLFDWAVGFESLPDGTQLLLRGKPTWKRIGES
jgi:hypothetical protein